MKKIISPLTNSNNVKLIKIFQVPEIIKRWKNQFDIDISDEFDKDNEIISLYQCIDSGLLFFEPKFEGSSNVYKELQNKFDWYYLEDKWEYDIAAKEINGKKNIIEIGSGKGTFISKIIKKYKVNIVGLETSEEAVSTAQINGLPVYLSNIDDFFKENPNYEVDVIISFQVLEHLSEPLNFLKQHISYMKIKSKLILCVPNVNCFYKYSDELLDMPPHHATKWSKETFLYLEKILPIKLKKIYYEPLHKLHKNIWLRNYSKHFRSETWYGILLFNKITTPIISKLLDNSGFRKLIIGHTIYVSFEKVE
ncbi:class I SAM-dependent methyltransferase [Flavobacterium bizetiae]|uniref:class I SAM-dependent methyltransferase n=1 Tax=Flavobacterium bizetiae TaxID=2704140 RepID=UPI0037571FF5